MKKILVRIIFIILILVICIIIFGFSNQNGVSSKEISGKVAKIIIDLKKDTSELKEKEKEDLIEVYQPIIRKGAHFLIYTLLGIAIMSFISTFNINIKKKILITFFVGIIYAIFDEIHQIFIAERTAKFTDVIIDSIGVVIGICIIMIIMQISIKLPIRSRKNR